MVTFLPIHEQHKLLGLYIRLDQACTTPGPQRHLIWTTENETCVIYRGPRLIYEPIIYISNRVFHTLVSSKQPRGYSIELLLRNWSGQIVLLHRFCK